MKTITKNDMLEAYQRMLDFAETIQQSPALDKDKQLIREAIQTLTPT